ncbi:hypothetical protein ACFLUK_00960 [Chloroflexota bacterium]
MYKRLLLVGLILTFLVTSCKQPSAETPTIIPTPLSPGTLVVTADTAIPEGDFGDRLINVTITRPGIADISPTSINRCSHN